MFCVSLSHIGFEECKAALRDLELAEIRLDTLRFSIPQVRELFSSHSMLIATHWPGPVSEEDRQALLLAAVKAGAAYVDIEVEAADGFKKAIIKAARHTGCTIIISYHNFEKTPAKEELLTIIDRCFESGAGIAKIACRSLSEADSARILSLYDCPESRRGRILALSMGEKGKVTRIAAPLLGAPFVFAAPGPGRETAPGQLDIQTLKNIIEQVKP